VLWSSWALVGLEKQRQYKAKQQNLTAKSSMQFISLLSCDKLRFETDGDCNEKT